jgi:hypothetical protein
MSPSARVGVAVAAAACAVAVPAAAAPPIPTPIGVGPQFHPTPTSTPVARAQPIGRLSCGARFSHLVRAHVELFARGRVVIVPAGIGMAPPVVVRDGVVRRARCSYPVRTVDPTGVVEVDASVRPTLRDLFVVWGRRLSPQALLGFPGRVRAYVTGKPRLGDPRTIPLRRHAQIVLEVGPYIPPHRTYLFGPGR